MLMLYNVLHVLADSKICNQLQYIRIIQKWAIDVY